ncbi:MAG TPA: copper chaperone PCu(A)C [Telluria sp.]|nr:copper chaperone PCu(A)C [Telluria sp.]
MNPQLLRAALAATLALAAAGASAQVTIKNAWIRATVPVQKATGAFMQITSAQDARLVAVTTPVAGLVELHQMDMKGGMMNMRHVESIDLPAGKPVELASGGYHVMLLELKRQMKAGDTVPLTLVVENKDRKRSTVAVTATVKPLTAH